MAALYFLAFALCCWGGYRCLSNAVEVQSGGASVLWTLAMLGLFGPASFCLLMVGLLLS